ncbi:metallophosphoesterase [Candidatus Woesearchaeota archaeon]|jgi:uncharacterized protein|nr:metallophosphoesterase [Candidatus Woesearchaeota archaeon]
MKILDNLKIVDLGILYKDIFILGDLQLGYEDQLRSKGVLVPKFQYKDIVERLRNIFSKNKINKIILNGDIKHEFGKINPQEWDEVLGLFDFLQDNVKEIIVIKGNHDVILDSILARRDMDLYDRYDIDNITIIHGDKLFDDLCETVIIAHEHPAVSFKEKPTEKFKCFLVGKFEKSNLIVMPSFTEITVGSDISRGKFLSPFLDDISKFKCYIVGDDDVVKDFGLIDHLAI